jgi:hypothetical protein
MSLKLSEKKLVVLGAGKLGGILLRAYLKQGLFDVNRTTATVKHAERAAGLAKELGIAVTTDNREAVKGADIILLTVKPQAVAEVLQEIATEIGPQTLLVSVAASVPDRFRRAATHCGHWWQARRSGSGPSDAKHSCRCRLRDDCNLWWDSCEARASRHRSQHVRRRRPDDCA